jgi:hypothetical protein
MERNPHSDYIDGRIQGLLKSTDWDVKIVDTTHEAFVRAFSSNVFTNFIQHIFTKAYMKKHPCSDCKAPSTDRCHGIGEERPLLIKKALERVWPVTTSPITMKEVLLAFLEEHKTTRFTFKCKACHRKESCKIEPVALE